MSPAPLPAYHSPGEENFKHGAETYRKHCKHVEKVFHDHDKFGMSLVRGDMHRNGVGSWTSEQLEELWKLRYETTPKWNYDRLARHFKRSSTWDICNALCLLQDRKHAGIDMFAPISAKASERSTKPKVFHRNPEGRKNKISSKDYCRLKGAGYSYREISEIYGVTKSAVNNVVYRFRKDHPDEYRKYFEEGKATIKK